MAWEVGLLIAILAVVFVAFILWLLWVLYSSNGEVRFVTSLPADETIEEARNYFVPRGWRVVDDAGGFIRLRQPTGAFTGLVLLVLLLPVGLIYLLTDWGHGKLEISVQTQDVGHSAVRLLWRDSSLRKDAKLFAAHLQGAVTRDRPIVAATQIDR